MPDLVKQISIEGSGTKSIGAESENIGMYKNTNNQYVDSTTEGTKTSSTLVQAMNTKLDITDVAPIENGTKYSKGYSKGDQFIRNGLLYEVTADTVTTSTNISTGSGGNATLADCVVDQLTDVKQTLSNDWLMRGNAYAFSVSANNSNIDDYAEKLGITASTTLEQLCDIVTSQLTGEKSATVIINTNDVILSSTAPQFLRDICALFGYDSCPQAHFEINILDNGTPTKLEIRYSDKHLKNISVIRVVDGVVSEINSFALSDSTIKVIEKGSIESNTSYTFTCVNNHIYRMTIQSIGTNAGSVVVFGKHPSVNDVKYSNYPSGNPQDPTISASGSNLTVTAATSAKVFYVIEDIYTP